MKFENKYKNLKDKFEITFLYRETLLVICKKILSAKDGAVFPIDLLICAIIDRSIKINDSFIQCFSDCNFTVSPVLVRLQIDNLIKLTYLSTENNLHQLGSQVFSEERFDRLRDPRTNQRLTDKFLQEYSSNYYDWLEKMYHETSVYVHLSPRHLYNTMSEFNSNTSSISIGSSDDHWPTNIVESLLSAYLIVTDSLSSLMGEYADQKAGKNITRNND